MSRSDDHAIHAAFAQAQAGWRDAVEAHRLAPPDIGFSARLAALSGAARIEAKICREAHAAGYDWPSHKGANKAPWELQPESGRRGPEHLWRTFDNTTAELSRASAGTNLLEVANAYEALAAAAADLAEAVRREDGVSAPLTQSRRARSA
jgi:hypothetical protein